MQPLEIEIAMQSCELGVKNFWSHVDQSPLPTTLRGWPCTRIRPAYVGLCIETFRLCIPAYIRLYIKTVVSASKCCIKCHYDVKLMYLWYIWALLWHGLVIKCYCILCGVIDYPCRNTLSFHNASGNFGKSAISDCFFMKITKNIHLRHAYLITYIYILRDEITYTC